MNIGVKFFEFIKGGIKTYNNLLLSHPFKTKMISAGLTFGVGDFLCQKFIEKRGLNDYEYSRTLR